MLKLILALSTAVISAKNQINLTFAPKMDNLPLVITRGRKMSGFGMTYNVSRTSHSSQLLRKVHPRALIERPSHICGYEVLKYHVRHRN